MDRYDPSASPDPDEWLGLDEQERSLLVDEYHRHARVELPNVTLHATIHVVVENQLAMGDERVVSALARLMKDGLTRHDAIHAIGSVVAENIFDILKAKDSAEVARARYYAAVERLTAAKWLAGHDALTAGSSGPATGVAGGGPRRVAPRRPLNANVSRLAAGVLGLRHDRLVLLCGSRARR